MNERVIQGWTMSGYTSDARYASTVTWTKRERDEFIAKLGMRVNAASGLTDRVVIESDTQPPHAAAGDIWRKAGGGDYQWAGGRWIPIERDMGPPAVRVDKFGRISGAGISSAPEAVFSSSTAATLPARGTMRTKDDGFGPYDEVFDGVDWRRLEIKVGKEIKPTGDVPATSEEAW